VLTPTKPASIARQDPILLLSDLSTIPETGYATAPETFTTELEMNS
jgi:hypothetical protein